MKRKRVVTGTAIFNIIDTLTGEVVDTFDHLFFTDESIKSGLTLGEKLVDIISERTDKDYTIKCVKVTREYRFYNY